MRACCAAPYAEQEVVEGRLPDVRPDTRTDALAQQVETLLRRTEEIQAAHEKQKEVENRLEVERMRSRHAAERPDVDQIKLKRDAESQKTGQYVENRFRIDGVHSSSASIPLNEVQQSMKRSFEAEEAREGWIKQRQVEAATWKLQVEDGRLTSVEVGNKHEGPWRVRRDDEKDDLKHAHAEVERLRQEADKNDRREKSMGCLLYTSPSPRDRQKSRMPSSA